MGMPSLVEHLQPQNNVYNNPFGTEVALFRTIEGGMSRMAVNWDTPGEAESADVFARSRGRSTVRLRVGGDALPEIQRPLYRPALMLAVTEDHMVT